MFNKSRKYRSASSFKDGGQKRFHTNKPFKYGHSSNRKKFVNKSKGKRIDQNLFINKSLSTPINQNPLTHQSFDNFSLTNPVKINIKNKGYSRPTDIQDRAITPILEGKDVIGLANTGTGKTAAFLIPMIDKLFRTRNQKLLVIVPTRELAVQINEEFKSFAMGLKLYSALIIGGANMNRQTHEIRRNPHVVIATPGRLKDLIERKVIRLDDFTNIVLDEVDLMVDIGFINDVKFFIERMPRERQSLFFSATISPKVESILKSFVKKEALTIAVKKQATSENIDQDIIHTIKDKKIDQLHDLLIQDGFEKVLVFGNTKHGIEKLHKELIHRGFKVGAIHGNKKQGYRQRVLKNFRDDQIQILLATDVASRGLDIDNVTHVINYEQPTTYEDYIHRIGRTGRADKKGFALTFVD